MFQVLHKKFSWRCYSNHWQNPGAIIIISFIIITLVFIGIRFISIIRFKVVQSFLRITYYLRTKEPNSKRINLRLRTTVIFTTIWFLFKNDQSHDVM